MHIVAVLLLLSSCCSERIVVSTYAGNGSAGDANGPGTTAEFNGPIDVATDGNGNLYVADHNNNSIRKVATNKTVSMHYHWAARPNGGFVNITKLDSDINGNLYVLDGDNLSIRRVASGTSATITGFRRDDEFYWHYVSSDGGPDSAAFWSLTDITLDYPGTYLKVIDDLSTGDMIRSVTFSGNVKTLNDGRFGSITMDGAGNTYASVSSKIVKISADGTIVDFVGSNTSGYTDGLGSAAAFEGISAIDADKHGNIYVCDNGNHRIRKVSPAGLVTTLAGDGTEGFADGAGVSAKFGQMSGVVVHKCALYVADTGNNRIRKITIPKP